MLKGLRRGFWGFGRFKGVWSGLRWVRRGFPGGLRGAWAGEGSVPNPGPRWPPNTPGAESGGALGFSPWGCPNPPEMAPNADFWPPWSGGGDPKSCPAPLGWIPWVGASQTTEFLGYSQFHPNPARLGVIQVGFGFSFDWIWSTGFHGSGPLLVLLPPHQNPWGIPKIPPQGPQSSFGISNVILISLIFYSLFSISFLFL